MINTNIRFNGFYESIHSSNIDFAIESYCADDDGYFNYDDLPIEINYKTIFQDYIEVFTDDFKTWLKDEYGVNIEFKDIKLISPKEYNFETDVINCNISARDNALLIAQFKRDKDFIKYLDETTTSRSGFISFYSMNDALQDKNNILSDYILGYLVRQFEADGFNLDNYDFIYQSLSMSHQDSLSLN